MANTTLRRLNAINLRDGSDRASANIYLPAMPPVGLSRAIGRWLHSRRRARGATPVSALNGYLRNDIGMPNRQRPQLNERQLTAFYAQPLGNAPHMSRRGEPAEHHATRCA